MIILIEKLLLYFSKSARNVAPKTISFHYRSTGNAKVFLSCSEPYMTTNSLNVKSNFNKKCSCAKAVNSSSILKKSAEICKYNEDSRHRSTVFSWFWEFWICQPLLKTKTFTNFLLMSQVIKCCFFFCFKTVWIIRSTAWFKARLLG